MLTTRGFGRLVDPITGRTIDNSEIVSRCSRRAGEFRALGLSRHDRVLLHHGNTLDFFIDLLAAWRLGACAIPLDTRLTASEVATVALAAKPKLSLWNAPPPEGLARALSELRVAVINASDDRTTHDPEDAQPAGAFALDDEALILFTSGTTGDPKGVVHTHRTLRARWTSLHTALGIEAFRRTLCLLPTHFGHGLICNCLFPWLYGQDLYILPPFRADILINLGNLIDGNEITCLSSVPTVWRLALKTGRPPAKRTLARVFCGSAPLSADLWRAVQQWTNTKDVVNAYGITETGSWLAGASLAEMAPEDGLVGRSWGGALAILRNCETQPSPDFSDCCKPDEPGFVWVKTPALMKGYLDRDDLTSTVISEGWFSTRDIGVLDERGNLYLRGRVSEEINKSGQKVHPGDVDRVIESFPETTDVCSFAVNDPLHGEDVGVAIVLKPGSPDVIARLHRWTRDRLAPHQMPKYWYLVDAIPRTSRGKVNRKQVAGVCESLAPIPVSRLMGLEPAKA